MNRQLINEVLGNRLVQELLAADIFTYAEMIKVIRQHRIESVLDIGAMQALIDADAETFATAMTEMQRERGQQCPPSAVQETKAPAPLTLWQRFITWIKGICRAIVSSK